MPYIQKTQLYSRPYRNPRAGVMGLGGVWDDITGFLSNVGGGFATAEQQQGAAQATLTAAQQQALILQAQQAQSGPGIGTFVVLGGAAALIYYLVKK